MREMMKTDQNNFSAPYREKGFTMVTAIFILIVLAGLGIFISTISRLEQDTAALDALSQRAYQSAKAGTEWGLYQVLINTGGAYAIACQPGPTTQSFAPITGFTVTVQCSSTSYSEASSTVIAYDLVANACNVPLSGSCPNASTGSIGYVDRELRVTFTR
jgi:MSHA biogenesis protein MshP